MSFPNSKYPHTSSAGLYRKDPLSILLLVDTPNSFTGQAGKVLKVNAAGKALEFTELPVQAVIEYGTNSIRTGSDVTTFGNTNVTIYGRDIDAGVGNFVTAYGQSHDFNGGAYTNPASLAAFGQNLTLTAGGSGANGTVLIGTALSVSASNRSILVGFNLTKNYGSQSNLLMAFDSTFASQEKILHIGWGSTIDTLGQVGVETDGGVSIGHGMTAKAARHTQVGHLIQNEGVSNSLFGYGAKALKPSGLATTLNVTHTVVLGRGGYFKPIVNTTDNGQGAIVFGGIGQNEFSDGVSMFFNNGWTHRYHDMNTANVVAETDATNRRVYIHGTDAYDDIDGTSINIAGGDLILMPGRPTGTGAGGVFKVKIADGVSLGGNIKQATNDKIVVDNGDTATASPVQLRINGVMKRVSVGAVDSGGVGFRALIVPN